MPPLRYGMAGGGESAMIGEAAPFIAAHMIRRAAASTISQAAATRRSTGGNSGSTRVRSVLVAALLATPAAAAPAFDPVFADHAVVQRDKPLRVRGTAAAGERLTLSLAGQSVAVTADARGDWSAVLAPVAAGGPYRITVAGAERDAAIDDVMVGDVFLCGGQSNMSFLTKYATDAMNEVKRPIEPGIRFATVPLDQPNLPERRLKNPLLWRTVGPDTIGETSAVCYYMALDLKTPGVTIGLVRSSLGGTPIESWLGPDTLRRLAPYGERVAALETFARDRATGRAAWQAHVARWWATADSGGDNIARPGFDDGAWDWATLPGQRTPSRDPFIAGFSGVLWYRHAAMLDARTARSITALDLGTVAHDATVWINGRRVGARESGGAETFAVPRGVLREGRNTVAVRLLDFGSRGAARVCSDGCAWRSLGAPVPLAPDWRYQPGKRLGDLPLAARAPWTVGKGLGTLHNGMIAPIAPYGFKAVVWYQGESNVADPVDYRRLLPALMADWRGAFADPNLPFVVVQLTAFGPTATAPGRSDWAELREAQRQVVLADRHAALAVTIDVGDRWDIHPAQKKIVGQRVARAMRRVAYGEAVPDGGPRPLSATRRGDDIVVAFAATGGLKTLSSTHAIGFETCDVARACVFADGVVDGDRVTLKGTGAARVVRYAWANTPVVNLYGGDDIPAVPFELPVR